MRVPDCKPLAPAKAARVIQASFRRRAFVSGVKDMTHRFIELKRGLGVPTAALSATGHQAAAAAAGGLGTPQDSLASMSGAATGGCGLGAGAGDADARALGAEPSLADEVSLAAEEAMSRSGEKEARQLALSKELPVSWDTPPPCLLLWAVRAHTL